MSNAAPSVPRLTLAHMFPLVLVLFSLSSASAGMLLVAWFGCFHQSIGSQGLSVCIFLTSLFGGISIGGLGSARLLARFHPLRAWAGLQLGSAILSLVITRAYPWLAQFFDAQDASRFWRTNGAALLLLVPAMVAGASLRLMFITGRIARPQLPGFGLVFPAVTASAGAGALYSALLVLRHYDVDQPASIGFAAGLTCTGFAASLSSLAADDGPQEPGCAVPVSPSLLGSLGLIGVTVSGAPTLWIRLLSMLLGGAPYTLALVLAVTLIGIALGHVAGSLFEKRGGSVALSLAWCELVAVPALGWAAAMLGQNIPHWPVSRDLAIAPRFAFQLDLARTLFAILPAAIALGAILRRVRPILEARITVKPAILAGISGLLLGPPLFTVILAGTTPAFSERVILLLPALASLLALADAYGNARNSGSPARSMLHLALAAAFVLPLACLLTLYFWNLDYVPPEILAQ